MDKLEAYEELTAKLLRWYVHWLKKNSLVMDDRSKELVKELGLRKRVTELNKELSSDDPFDEERGYNGPEGQGGQDG